MLPSGLPRMLVLKEPGAVAEWLKATVLKTVVPKGTGGSNPSCSVRCHVVTSCFCWFLQPPPTSTCRHPVTHGVHSLVSFCSAARKQLLNIRKILQFLCRVADTKARLDADLRRPSGHGPLSNRKAHSRRPAKYEPPLRPPQRPARDEQPVRFAATPQRNRKNRGRPLGMAIQRTQSPYLPEH